MEKIFIFGASKYAQVTYSYLHDKFEIINFVVDNLNENPKSLFDIDVISTTNFLKKNNPNETKMYIAIAQSNLNYKRKNKYLFFKKKGFKFITYIDESITMHKSTKVGENTLIFDGCSIGPFTSIGNNCIIWQNAVVGHHVRIGDHCFMAGPSVVCGNSSVSENVYIGVSATIRDGIKIGSNVYIGAGCLIMKNAEKNSLYSSKSSTKSPISATDFFKINIKNS